jgi:hypothetical protein
MNGLSMLDSLEKKADGGVDAWKEEDVLQFFVCFENLFRVCCDLTRCFTGPLGIKIK